MKNLQPQILDKLQMMTPLQASHVNKQLAASYYGVEETNGGVMGP